MEEKKLLIIARNETVALMVHVLFQGFGIKPQSMKIFYELNVAEKFVNENFDSIKGVVAIGIATRKLLLQIMRRDRNIKMIGITGGNDGDLYAVGCKKVFVEPVKSPLLKQALWELNLL